MKTQSVRIMIYPKDFSTARAFYEQVLNLDIHQDFEKDGVVMYTIGNNNIIELLTTSDEQKKSFRCKMSLEVDNVHQLWEQLKYKTNIIFELRNNSWGDTSFCIQDPDGNHLTFFSKR